MLTFLLVLVIFFNAALIVNHKRNNIELYIGFIGLYTFHYTVYMMVRDYL